MQPSPAFALTPIAPSARARSSPYRQAPAIPSTLDARHSFPAALPCHHPPTPDDHSRQAYAAVTGHKRRHQANQPATPQGAGQWPDLPLLSIYQHRPCPMPRQQSGAPCFQEFFRLPALHLQTGRSCPPDRQHAR